MKKVILVLVAVLFGCATAPAPKFVGDSYYDDKHRFSLEKPIEWQQLDFRKMPEQLMGPVPPGFRKAMKITLFERSSGSFMFIAVDKAQCTPQQIPMVASMTQEVLIAGMKSEPGAIDVKRCSGVNMTAQDACIEILSTEGALNTKMNMFMKFYPVGSQAKVMLVGFGSPEQVYDVHFPAFQKIINSLRCGEDYKDYKRAVEVDLKLVESYNNRGLAHYKKGEYDQAISHYNEAITLNPKYDESYNNRGLAHYKKGEYDQAISDYYKAVALNPRCAEAYNNRGLAYYKKGRYDRAISDYNKAIEINPRFSEAYNNRGLACYKKGEYDKAWEDVHKAASLDYQVLPGFLEDLRQASGRQR